MTTPVSIAIFMIVWWVVLFAVLPFGVVSQHEAGLEREGGNDPGAPVRPLMWRKLFITTIIALVVWSGVMWVVIAQPISFDQIPFMPKYQDWPGADGTHTSVPANPN
jgi:predicted secreted protein